MFKSLNRIATCAGLILSLMVWDLSVRADGKAYTWVGADGGSWGIASNWDDGSGQSTGSPGPTDFAQFQNASANVVGAVGANFLNIGPGSSVTLGGSGFFNQITIGMDLDANVGAANLKIGSGQVVSATLMNLDSVLGGSGTLTAAGTFSTSGGIIADQTGLADSIIVQNGGQVLDGAGLTMAAGGLIQVASSGQMVIGNAGGGGTNGALTIASGSFFYGEGTISGNVVVNGQIQTFNAGLPVGVLTITGNTTGTGSVVVVQELDLDGAVGSGVTFTLAGNLVSGGSNKGLLRIADGADFQGMIGVVSTGSVIDLEGLSFDHVEWSAGAQHAGAPGEFQPAAAGPGTLTLTGASGTLVLSTTGDYSGVTLSVQADPISGTDIVFGATAAPEPASVGMLVAGVGMLMLRRRRRVI